MRYLLLLVLVLPACNITPTQRWAAARETLTTTTKALTFMAKQKLLTDEQIVEVDVAVKTARAGLEEAEKQLPDGGSSFEDVLDVVQAMIERLSTLQDHAKENARKPTSISTYKEPSRGPSNHYRGDHWCAFAHRGRGQLGADPARERPDFRRAA